MAGPGRLSSGLKVMHVDMDAFFASVEQRDDPSLRGKPVIVGGRPGGRGVVCAASYEARAYGVRSAMSTADAYRRCPDGVYLPVRGEAYREASDRVMAILHDFTPIVEPLSLDEAFLDIRGTERLLGDAESIARRIRARILDEVGLVASAGVAPNKLVAKIASDHDKPDGLVVVRPEEVESFLADLPIERMWGIGPVTASGLRQHGITRLGDIVRLGEEGMAEVLGGERALSLVQRAHGIDERRVKPDRSARSIGHETTFPADRSDDDYLHATLLRLAEGVGRRLRRAEIRGGILTLRVRFRGFQTVTRRVTLSAPTDLDEEIYAAARSLLHDRVDRRGRPIRLLGISMSRLGRASGRQLGLFIPDRSEKRGRAAAAIDEIRERMGRTAIGRAGVLKSHPPRYPNLDIRDETVER